jgi:cell division protein ZapA
LGVGQVRVAINGRSYNLGCDDGEEERVERLAGLLDRRVGEIAANVGQVGDTRLLLMVSLLLADELTTARNELDDLRGVSTTVEVENKSLNQLIKRLESIAANVENA